MAKKITVVTDEDSGEEALYSDGTLIMQDATIYACDIATAAGGDEVLFEHRSVCMPDDWDMTFPNDASDLPENTDE